MDENCRSQNNDLVNLWEQMGSSTGGLLGTIIGLSVKSGLQIYNQTIINPLKQFSTSGNTSEENSDSPGLREQTWSTMGSEYGEIIGKSIGLSMDLLISSLDNIFRSPEKDQPINIENCESAQNCSNSAAKNEPNSDIE